ncbi:MAG: hypothetical protein RR945_06430 [Erysipelotrichaceae bacterium]
MKKLVLILVIQLLLVGCGSKDKTMICSLKQNNMGTDYNLKIKVIHDGEIVNQQIQKTIVKFDSKRSYQMGVETLRQIDFTGMSEGMKGISYTLKEDEKGLEIVEELNIDFSTVSGTDYNKITNGILDIKDDKIIVTLEKTKESMKAQGLTCEY